MPCVTQACELLLSDSFSILQRRDFDTPKTPQNKGRSLDSKQDIRNSKVHLSLLSISRQDKREFWAFWEDAVLSHMREQDWSHGAHDGLHLATKSE